jgi:hypothetical protein
LFILIRIVIILRILDPGSRGQKGTGSRIRIRNTACCAELEAEGGEPELVEQLSGQLAADSRAVLEV